MSKVKAGDKIRLIKMPRDPDPIKPGSLGIVTSVTEGPLGQIEVDWDSDRTLSLIPGVDKFEIISSADVTSSADTTGKV